MHFINLFAMIAATFILSAPPSPNMNFEYWSFEKKRAFINELKYKSKGDIYKRLKEEDFEIFPQGENIMAISPGGEYYYFQLGLRPRSEDEKKLKAKYRHRYIIVRT